MAADDDAPTKLRPKGDLLSPSKAFPFIAAAGKQGRAAGTELVGAMQQS